MSDIEVSVFNVQDVSEDQDQSDLMFDVVVGKNGGFAYRFVATKRDDNLYYDGDQEFADDTLYQLVWDSIDELNANEQAEVLLKVVDSWSEHLVRDNLWVVLRSEYSAAEQAAMAPGAYCLMNNDTCVPFDTAAQYIDLISRADQDGIEALAQAATIRHALGVQTAAASTSRKM